MFHLMFSLAEDLVVPEHWLSQLHPATHKLYHPLMELYRWFLTDLH